MLDTFAAAFAAEIRRANLSQGEVGRLSGLSQSAISQYMSGKREPGIAELAKLCQVFPRLLLWAARTIAGPPETQE